MFPIRWKSRPSVVVDAAAGGSRTSEGGPLDFLNDMKQESDRTKTSSENEAMLQRVGFQAGVQFTDC